MDEHRQLLTISGRDRPGLAAELFRSLRAVAVAVTDIGQITIRGHLVLCVEVDLGASQSLKDLALAVEASGIAADGAIQVEIAATTERAEPGGRRLAVTLLAPSIDPEQLASVFGTIARCGGESRAARAVRAGPSASSIGRATAAPAPRTLSMVAAAARTCSALAK